MCLAPFLQGSKCSENEHPDSSQAEWYEMSWTVGNRRRQGWKGGWAVMEGDSSHACTLADIWSAYSGMLYCQEERTKGDARVSSLDMHLRFLKSFEVSTSVSPQHLPCGLCVVMLWRLFLPNLKRFLSPGSVIFGSSVSLQSTKVTSPLVAGTGRRAKANAVAKLVAWNSQSFKVLYNVVKKEVRPG